MKHAIIIGNDPHAARAIEEQLATMGFHSFERARSEDAAVGAAARRCPDLIVVGEAVDQGCPLEAARRISSGRDIPMLLAACPDSARRPLPPDVRLSGPFPLQKMKEAVGEAERAEPQLTDT